MPLLGEDVDELAQWMTQEFGQREREGQVAVSPGSHQLLLGDDDEWLRDFCQSICLMIDN